jgi:hypothetical protein
MDELTAEDISLILESLRYTKEKFANYDRYPSEEFRRSRMADVEAVVAKIRRLRNG